MARLTVPLVRDAINKYHGNVSAVARAFGVSRTAVYNYIRRYPELREVLTDARESLKDNVISRFYADCLKDDPRYQTSRIFFLKTQCADRGYVERHELTGKDAGPIQTTEVPYDLSRLTDEELDQLDQLLNRATIAVQGRCESGVGSSEAA
ncbi:MAG TPA: hypothetical protein VKD90_21610 [Gemmataceae bacterium]|nr:hypothetical protein [Gemmataceae bacterium]